MIAMIQRLRRPSDASTVVSLPPVADIPAVHAELTAFSDAKVMDIPKGLQIWKDMPSYRSYLMRFATGYGRTVDAMNASLAVNDVAGAAALAHKLAGVAANLALPDTHRLAVEAQRVLAGGYDPTEVLARLENSLALALASIERFVTPEPQDGAFAEAEPLKREIDLVNLQSLKTLLAELLAALYTDNPDPAYTVLVRLKKQVTSAEFTRVWECVQGYDFRGAEAATNELAHAHDISMKD